jgi:hypothetical protein
MPKQSEGFLSEDGQSYTKFVEVPEEEQNDKVDDNQNRDASDFDKIVSKVKVEDLPENVRGTFNELITHVKGLNDVVARQKEQSGTVEVLQNLVAQLKQPQPSPGETPKPRVKLSESLKFEKDDYYAPFFTQLASAIDAMTESVEQVKTIPDKVQRENFVSTVKKYVADNRVPVNVIQKMDQIASPQRLGPGTYNDLNALHTLAKLELGIKDVPKREESVSTKRSVEFNGRRRSETNVESKPAKTMMEAWDQAESQLADKD